MKFLIVLFLNFMTSQYKINLFKYFCTNKYFFNKISCLLLCWLLEDKGVLDLATGLAPSINQDFKGSFYLFVDQC